MSKIKIYMGLDAQVALKKGLKLKRRHIITRYDYIFLGKDGIVYDDTNETMTCWNNVEYVEYVEDKKAVK